jgi:hypothetical protein
MKFKSFDIILFAGKGFVSRMIQAGSFSRMSHVGICIDEELMIESTTLSNLEDVILGECIEGVQIVRTSDRIKTYNGKIFLKEIKEETTKEQFNLLLERAKELHGRPYEENKWNLIMSEIPLLPNRKSNLESIFCSELVVELLKYSGVMPELKNPDSYSPAEIKKFKEPYDKKVKRIK